MTNLNLSTFQNSSTPTTTTFTTINEWLDKIKNNPNATAIEAIRAIKTIDVAKYKKFKKQQPTIVYNALLDGYRSNKHITSSTGLMYFDVDKDGFDINLIDTNKIFAYYKSFGGTGYGILVKVEGLTLSNYSATFDAITEDLGIIDFYDVKAKKMVQQSILSFDPKLFYNPNSTVFQSSVTISNQNKVKTFNNDLAAIMAQAIANDHKFSIRFDDRNKFEFADAEYIVDFKTGMQLTKALIPMKKIKDGFRYNFFMGYGANLLVLNPHLHHQGLINNLLHVNAIACVNKIEEAQLFKIATMLINQRDNGTLQSKEFYKKNKILFAPNSKLTKEEKFEIVRAEVIKNKTENSIEKIYKIIEEWNFSTFGKITQATIVKNHPITKKTVEKYWSNFKEYVTDLNKKNNLVKSKKEKNMDTKVLTKKQYVDPMAVIKNASKQQQPKAEKNGVTTKENIKIEVENKPLEATLPSIETLPLPVEKEGLNELTPTYLYDVQSNQILLKKDDGKTITINNVTKK